MNTTTKNTIAEYVTLADGFSSTTPVAQLKAALLTLGYAKAEVSTEAKITAAAKVERTALLHRARAVKSTAKRNASR